MSNKFENFKLSNQLMAAINRLGYTEPTTIQEKTLKSIVEGKDVVGESATGSGKTLAFGCGVVEKSEPKEGIQGLVLLPTRELAEQVRASIEGLAYKKSLNIVAIFGGVGIGPQIDDLKRANVVVATPGRLLDHISRNSVDLSNVKILVLDEADRMLDMGFIDDVEKIIKKCPKDRQTLFFSATISSKIQELANRYMKNPEKVAATKQVDPSKLLQIYYDVPKNKKLSLLINLLKNDKTDGLSMIFCNTRINTDFVVKNLKNNGLRAFTIHGGLTQNKRSKTIEEFNNGKFNILVATDVAARGLHIDNVSHVYNYDLPRDPTDYVHRIGRTARAGEDGLVVNILCDFDYDNFSKIQREYSTFTITKQGLPQLEMVVAIKADDRERGSDRRGGPRGSGNRDGPRNRSGPRDGNRSGPRNNSESGPRNRDGPRSNDDSRPRRTFHKRSESEITGNNFGSSSSSSINSASRSRR